MSLPRPWRGQIQPLRGWPNLVADTFRRFHLRLMILGPFGTHQSVPAGVSAAANLLDIDVLKFYYVLELMDALRHLKLLNVVVNPAWGSHSVRRT